MAPAHSYRQIGAACAVQDELGVVLVEKSGRGVRLTEAGHAMAAAAADVSTAMARAEATIDTYRQGWRTHVKAAFFPSAAGMILPGLLHRVKASRSIVALARPDVAARTAIQQVLAMPKTEARAVAEAPELREAAH